MKDNHFSFPQQLREKLASFFERKNKVDRWFEILSTYDHVLGDGSPFLQLNGPAKEIDPILGHIRRFSFTEEIFLRDGYLYLPNLNLQQSLVVSAKDREMKRSHFFSVLEQKKKTTHLQNMGQVQ